MMGATASVSEVYISLDVETLGGNPHTNPMFNLGAVCMDTQRKELGAISINFSDPVGAVADRDTLAWFQREHAEAYTRMCKDQRTPLDGMKEFRTWCEMMTEGGKHRVVFLCAPTIYDGSWLYSYWFRYLGHPAGGKGPGFQVIDVRSYGMGRLGLSTYTEANKTRAFAAYCPSADAFPHTHEGLDDAREQAHLFFNLRDNRKGTL
jgi:hypothetical protein